MIKRILVGLIRLYQKLVSPLLPKVCRYYPSCSNYAVESIVRFGALRGFYLTFLRILTCHRGSKGGYDPVPESWLGWKEVLIRRKNFLPWCK